ncbi:MAG TPA: nucleotide exchange factor GrpE [Terriglobia bacterium]|nr:nucleotide exchange factor GrpE [Terriglobia bacterium]HEX5482540.1 nucleotide exchange factor GrpE [Terriglobia bacterium]
MEAEKDFEKRKTQVPPEEPESGLAGAEGHEQEPSGDLQTAYQKLAAEKQELYDRLLRKQAEFENFRKRTQREKEEFLQHANFDLLRSLLPVLDGFDRALKQRDPKAPAQFYEGLELIHRQLLEILGRAGLAAFEAQGKTFDPELHQAVETVESPEHREHEVVEELQRGYKLKHRLLRPAVVKVAVPGPQPRGGKNGVQG